MESHCNWSKMISWCFDERERKHVTQMGIGLLAGGLCLNKISGLRKFSKFDLVYKMLFSPFVLLFKPHFSSYISIIPKISLFALLHQLKKKKNLLSMPLLLCPPSFQPLSISSRCGTLKKQQR